MVSRNELGIRFLLRWTIQAVISGLIAASLVHLFDATLRLLWSWREVSGFSPIPLAIAAALVTGFVLYRIAPTAAGEGIPAYLDAIRDRDAALPLRDTIVKYPAALLSLGFYGSGGIVGPLGRVVSGFAQAITTWLQHRFPHLFADGDTASAHYHAPTTAAISGMAAAVAAIFHAPIAGAVFAVEIIQSDQLRYHQLFPAVLASVGAVFFMDLFGWPAPLWAIVPSLEPDTLNIVPVIIVGLFSGSIGRFYTGFYRVLARRMGRYNRKNRTVRLIFGMTAAASLSILVHPAIGGTSPEIPIILGLGDVTRLQVPWIPWTGALLLIVIMVVKIVANCVTVASGMSAGFTGPAALVGMLAGAAVALAFGYEPGGYTYTTLVVAGFAGTLASTMNIPLAASILAMEVFAPSFGVPAGLASILGFQTARYNTIYEVALETRRRAKL
ncbi:MAG: chloride channel protein [Alkalispirochaeta sp.]